MDATRHAHPSYGQQLRRWARTGLVLVYGQKPGRRRSRHGPRFDLGVLGLFLFLGLGYMLSSVWPS